MGNDVSTVAGGAATAFTGTFAVVTLDKCETLIMARFFENIFNICSRSFV